MSSDHNLLKQDEPLFDLASTILTTEEALKCLKGESTVILPLENAKACNNLDEYFIKSTNGKKPSTKLSSRSSEKGAKSETKREPFAVPLVRNFERILKKPLDTLEEGTSNYVGLIHRPKKSKPDIFSRTEDINSSSGPLALLKQRIDQTVVVLIRRRRKVPYISRTIEYKGILVLFDKHMNLYLKDVIESFTYKTDEKLYKRARHRDEILLRGDNIILVK